MGSKGGGSETVTTKVEIPEFLRPLVRQGAGTSQQALSALTPRLLSQRAASFDPLEIEAQRRAAGIARGAGRFFDPAEQELLRTVRGADPLAGIDPSAVQALQSTAGGDFLFGGQGFDAAVAAARNQIVPQILSQFAGGGAGAAQGGLAQESIARAIADQFAGQFGQERGRQLQAAGALADIGQTERGRQLAATQVLPGLVPQRAAAEAGILERVGAGRRAQREREREAPVAGLERLLAASQGVAPTTAFLGQSQTQPGPSRNLGAGILGGVATGAGILEALGGGFGGPATLAAVLGGGLLGGF